jgi:hypothetical protein
MSDRFRHPVDVDGPYRAQRRRVNWRAVFIAIFVAVLAFHAIKERL